MSRIFFTVLFLLSYLVGPSAARGQDAVTWMHADFPPLRILDGPFSGLGPSDMIHNLMRREMPDVEQSVVTANLKRTVTWMGNGEKVLSVGIIPGPERDKVMQYSVPCVVVPPVCLVVRADAHEVGRRVSLRDFVGGHLLGVAAGRSYGLELDAVLAAAPESSRVVANLGSNLFETLMEMLLLGRVDGVLAYPFEATYVARMKGREGKIALVPLKEAMMPIVGHVAAPRTPWGTAMIGRVNEVLLRHRGDPAYREAFERWLPPEMLDGYRAMYAEFLQSR